MELQKQKFQIDVKVENDVGMAPRLIVITNKPVSFSIFRTLVSYYIPEVSLSHDSTRVTCDFLGRYLHVACNVSFRRMETQTGLS